MVKKTIKRTICLVAAVAMAVVIATSQSVDFSTDYAEFVQQMDEIFKTTTMDKKKEKQFIQELQAFFASPSISEEIKNHLISDCNGLRKIKARPTNYQTCIETYEKLGVNKKLVGSNYATWHMSVEAKLTSKQTPLQRTMNIYNATQEYIVDYCLKKTPSVRWRVDRADIAFRCEDGQLVLDVPQTRVVCLSQGDSIEVLETRGEYYFDDAVWKGDEGYITWERCKLPEAEVNAHFGNYQIDMTKNSLEIDSARFVNTNYFSHPLYGKIEHKVVSSRSSLGGKYPKFSTTNDHMAIKDIFKNIDYDGGFSQIGTSFQGSGTADNPATINIYRNDTLFVNARALSFVFYPDRIESLSAEVDIKLDDEQITHPSLHFRYLDKKRELHLIRSDEGIQKTLFNNTFHQVQMDVEFIKWKLESSQMELRMVEGTARGYAYFESSSYYREDYYYQLQGMELTHPFQHIVDFYRYNGGRPFYVEDYAAYRMLPAGEVRQQIIRFSFDNFVDYDENTDIVTPLDRMLNYMQYRLGKKDYDVIRFESLTSGSTPNAVLDLKNYDICLNGITGIAISDNQNVAFYPEDGKIILKRNRDFKFNGQIDAGMVSLKGDGFYFSYDNFRIEMSKIDEMQLKVLSNERDANGRQMLAYVGNTVSDFSGYLIIDEADNKSGNKKNPQYPILTSTKESYVYYDSKSIQNGQYVRDKFYFKVEPFTFENINDINPQKTDFHGVLTSAGIFPEIKQTLVIRDDYSLGFVQDTPSEGYPMYGGRATFYDKIDLSNRGLRGDGKLIYLTSSAASENFIFLPTYTRGLTYDFDVKKTTTGVTYPGVELGRKQRMMTMSEELVTGQTRLVYEPDKAELTVVNSQGNFQMFPTTKTSSGFECELSGQLTVTPQGLRGLGKTTLPMAAVEAETMAFTDHTITADTSYFATYRYERGETTLLSGAMRRDVCKDYTKETNKLYSTTSAKHQQIPYANDALREDGIVHEMWGEHEELRQFLMDNALVSHIDFDKREGLFTYKSALGAEWVSKSIKYKTRLKSMTWDMDRNLQIMGQKGTRGNRFVCTKESKDSLSFYAPVAIFDGINNTLTCQDVVNIHTADANVLLAENEQVIIGQDAVMDPLHNSTVELKTDSTYHKIYDATITIEGAKKYKGIGSYDLVNALGQTRTLFVSEIKTDKQGTTTATGTLGEVYDIDEYFRYKGAVSITTPRQLLEYDGGVRLTKAEYPGPMGYVRFNAVLDPKAVVIPIGERTYNWPNDEIYRSFFMRKDSVHAYTSFIETRKDHSDIPMITGTGVMHYNRIFECYEILPEAKRQDPSQAGTTFRYTPETCTIDAFGAINLGIIMPENRPVGFQSAGNLHHDRRTNTISANVLTEIDWFFATELATMIYKDILGSQEADCDSTTRRYEQRMAELYDTTQVKNIIAGRYTPLNAETGLLPDDDALFLFDNVELLWNTPKHAYICDTIVDLRMMRGRAVNKRVRIKAEFMSRKTGSTVDMLLSFDENSWYYFGYKSGNLQALSTNKEFNTTLQKIDPKERRSKERGVFYTLAPDSKRKRFLTNFGLPKTQTDDEDDEEDEEVAEEVDAAEENAQ